MRISIILPGAVLFTLCLLSLSVGFLENIFSLEGNTADLSNRFLSPSWAHFFGTDELGRDTFIRLLYGGRISLAVGFIAAFVSGFIGVTIGLLSGYVGGRSDAFLMRFTDILIALPLLPILIILSAVDLEKLGITLSEDTTFYKIIFIIGLTAWTMIARLTRARTLTLRRMDFIMAARALGVGNMRIILRHILPNLMGTVMVAITLSIGGIILMESVLSFLGLGIQPPKPSWGNMLSNAEDYIWEHPVLTFYPGVMIFITVLAFNFLGDGLQSIFDPKSKNN